MSHARNPFRASARRHLIAEHYFAGDSESWAFKKLSERIMDGSLFFGRNVNGRRIPTSLTEQSEQLERTIRTTYKLLNKDASNKAARNLAFQTRQQTRQAMPNATRPPYMPPRPPSAVEQSRQIREAQAATVRMREEQERRDRNEAMRRIEERNRELIERQLEERERAVFLFDEPEPVKPEPVKVKASASQSRCEEILSWIQDTLRPWTEARNADGENFDQVGLRPAENAAKMLREGISPAAIKHALTLHYPAAARRALNVKAYDPTTFEPTPLGPVTMPDSVKKLSGVHKAMPYVKALALAGVPIALVGPPGTGKTTLARHLAEELDAEFGMVSMTRGTSPSAFNGRPKIGGDGEVIQSQFERLYSAESEVPADRARVFLFDEMDASEPNLLLLVNAALANGHFANASTGQMVPRAQRWIPVAGMNTLGLGGDRKMVGREKQDAAALDRWHAGRVEIKLDVELETAIFWQIVTA